MRRKLHGGKGDECRASSELGPLALLLGQVTLQMKLQLSLKALLLNH